MVVPGPLDLPQFNHVLEQFGFDSQENLGFASIYGLNCATWQPPDPIEIAGAGWGAELRVSGEKFPALDFSTGNPQNAMITINVPTLIIACYTGTKTGPEAVALGRQRVEALLGLIASHLSGPLIGERLWEGVVQKAPSGMIRMISSHREIEARGLTRQGLQRSLVNVEKLSWSNIPDHLQLSLRALARAKLEDDRIDMFLGYYLAILPIIRTWHAQNYGGDRGERVRFRAYINDRMKIAQPRQNEVFDQFSDVHTARNELLKGAKFDTITGGLARKALNVAILLTRFEIGELSASLASQG